VNLASTSQGLNAKHLRYIFVKGIHKTVKQTTSKKHNPQEEQNDTSTEETKKNDKNENANTIEKQTINNTNQGDKKQ
jgi:hypothetical protein